MRVVTWNIASMSVPGKRYEVTTAEGRWSCSCPAFTLSPRAGQDCKHIDSVKSGRMGQGKETQYDPERPFASTSTKDDERGTYGLEPYKPYYVIGKKVDARTTAFLSSANRVAPGQWVGVWDLNKKRAYRFYKGVDVRRWLDFLGGKTQNNMVVLKITPRRG